MRTSAALDASSRTLLTEVDIVNPGMTLLSGMYAQAHLQLTHRAPALILPATALVVRSSGTQVDRRSIPPRRDQTSTIHFRPIVVGRDFGGTVEVQSGATDGMTVVSNPSADLVDGMKVKLARRAKSRRGGDSVTAVIRSATPRFADDAHARAFLGVLAR